MRSCDRPFFDRTAASTAVTSVHFFSTAQPVGRVPSLAPGGGATVTPMLKQAISRLRSLGRIVELTTRTDANGSMLGSSRGGRLRSRACRSRSRKLACCADAVSPSNDGRSCSDGLLGEGWTVRSVRGEPLTGVEDWPGEEMPRPPACRAMAAIGSPTGGHAAGGVMAPEGVADRSGTVIVAEDEDDDGAGTVVVPDQLGDGVEAIEPGVKKGVIGETGGSAPSMNLRGQFGRSVVDALGRAIETVGLRHRRRRHRVRRA